MVESGKGILYLLAPADRKDYCLSSHWKVSQWAGGFTKQINYRRTSFHNMAGKDGRTDVWFTGPDGKEWHGVNIGDNQICRVHRLKRQ